jgi:Sulfotransferase domain
MTVSADSVPAANGRPQQRVPDFFVVGHYKSGTTALYDMLRRHPQIYMPAFKELWFHSPELRARTRPDTLESYLSLFEAAGSEQRAGEATPAYLTSRDAARSIAELQPDARIIAILREPAAFLRSFHLQCLQNHSETEKDLRKALALEGARRRGKKIPRDAGRPFELLYSEHVRYVEQLRRYHAVFPPEQVLVLIYDDFRADNEGVARQVLRFLDVDDTTAIEMREVNPTVGVRAPRLSGLVRTLTFGRGRAGRPAKAAIKALTPQRLRHRAMAAEDRAQLAKPRPPDQELMRELRRRFKGEVVELSKYLDRDLVTLWGYDDVG